MEKQWQIMPAAPDSFFKTHSHYLPGVAQLLYNRNLTSQEAITAFLDPSSMVEFDPFLFKDMAAAIELVISHIKHGSRITICGDYDADGVTSSALLTGVLKILRAQVDVWIPSRFGEGYGLNTNIVKELSDSGVKLLITVDNGIRAKAEIALARSLGIDVIVTDHHEGPSNQKDLPDCLIINPILETETYPFKYLCGAGVAYAFARALITKSTLAELDKEKLKNQLVDLAAVGTISDCVTLFGENRLIVHKGLEQINHHPRRGLRELITVAGLSAGELTAWNISWQITPRLNAAGRIDHANTAYALLTANSSETALQLAQELNEKNLERQKLTEEIMNEGISLVERDQMSEKLLVVTSPDLRGEKRSWPEGVIGLVAGRLVERFSKPCFVICQSEGMIKGSGRSIDQLDLGASLEVGKEHLDRFGGHKMACGFTVKAVDNLEPFIKKIRDYVEEKLTGVDIAPVLRIEASLPLEAVSPNLLAELEKFTPYGQDNLEPKFVSFAVPVEEIMTMGQDKQHIKLRLQGMWALGFNKAELWKEIQVGDMVNIVYTTAFNFFNNRREVQLKIIDLRRYI